MPQGIPLTNAPTSSNTNPPPLTYVNGSVSANAKSTLTVVWKWVPYTMQGGTPAPAPTILNLLVSAPVTAGVSPNYGNSGPSSGLTGKATASNGLGDTVSATETSAPPSQSLPDKHLLSLPVDKATSQVTVKVSGSVTTSTTNNVLFGHLSYYGTNAFAYISNNGYTNNSPNGYTTVSSNANVGATVKQDQRAVTVSADVGLTYHKILSGGLDANGDGKVAQKANSPAPDGTMTGDIGISYGEQHLNNQSIEVVSSKTASVTYAGHIPGNWATQNAQYWWNSSLKNYSLNGKLFRLDGLLPTEADIPVLANVYTGAVVDSDHNGAIIPNDAAANGTTDHLFFKFQNGDNRPSYPTGNDGDQATATTNYYLTIHQPVEIFKSHKPDETHFRVATPNPRPNSDDIQLNPAQPGYAIYGGGIACTWNDPNVLLGYASMVAAELGDTSWKTYPWISAVAGIINIGIDNFGPKPDNGTANFDDTTWNNSTDFPPRYPKGSTPKTSYHMVPLLNIQYNWQYLLKDNYGSNGFVNEELIHIEKFQGTSQWLGHFYNYLNP